MSALRQKRTLGHVRAMSALPQKQTLELSRVMSALCQKQTHALQQKASSFDHLVRGSEQCRRHGEAEHPGGLGVDD